MIKEDEEREPERAREIAPHDIAEPVFTFVDARVAHEQDVEERERLKRNERPAVGPGTNRFRQAEIQQETIKDHHVTGMTGREAVIFKNHIDMDDMR